MPPRRPRDLRSGYRVMCSRYRSSSRCSRAGQARLPPPTTCAPWTSVSFRIERGETFGLVGESGSGKTTTARCAMRLVEPTSGAITFDGTDLLALAPGPLRRMRRHFQMVFQDPDASLNPRMRAGDIVEEPLLIHRVGPAAERRARVDELLGLVGLDPSHAKQVPAGVQRRPAPANRHRPRAGAQSRPSSWRTSPCRRSICRCRRKSST